MAGTAVKDVSSFFMKQAVSLSGKAVAGNGDFQKVWSSQMNRSTSGSNGKDGNVQNKTAKQPQKSPEEGSKPVADKEAVEPKEVQPLKQETKNVASKGNKVSEDRAGEPEPSGEELPEEELEAMQTLGTAAMALTEQTAQVLGVSVEELQEAMDVLGISGEMLSDASVVQSLQSLKGAPEELMSQIMDVFGISMEELQTVMTDLGLEQTDLLDAAKMGNLLLKLGGASDPCALLTDSELYEDYQAVMGEMTQVLKEHAEKFGVKPEQLAGLLQESSEEEISREKPEPDYFLQKEGNRKEEIGVVGQETKTDVPNLEQAGTKISEATSTEKQVPEKNLQEGLKSEEHVAAKEKEISEEKPKEDRNALTTKDSAEESRKTTGQSFVRGTESAQEEGEGQGTAGQSQQGKERHSQERTEGGRHFDFVTQDMRTESFRPELQQVREAAESPWSADTKEIMDQIMDYMKLNLKADTSSLEMQLHPANLGTLQIQIASKSGMVTAHFIVQNEAVKAALESQMIQLKEQFAEQDVKVEAIEVTVQTHEFEQNLEQGRGRSQQEPGKRNRTRKLQFGGGFEARAANEGEVTAEEEITAGGSTVSYRA